MNILVIGNGFDVAHGLPTKYQDFLEFVACFQHKFIKKNDTSSSSIFNDEKTQKKYEKHFENMEDNRKEEFSELIDGNVWFDHFFNVYEEKLKNKQNWIDFEAEISNVIQELDRIRKELKTIKEEKKETDESIAHKINNSSSIIYKLPDKLIYKLPEQKNVYSEHRLNAIKNILINDLNRLTRCFELYLNDYIKYDKCTPLPVIISIRADYLINFNYTDTFIKVYSKKNEGSALNEDSPFDYIHGRIRNEKELNQKAKDELAKKIKEDIKIENNEKFKKDYKINTCNFVLGIEEYLEGNEKNKDNEYIEFKKFYQRIYKRTGTKYTNWLRNFAGNINTYIYGHSIATTDGDIINNLIEASNKTIIFYHTQEALHDIILNLVQIIGEEKLIKYTSDVNKKIEFQSSKTIKLKLNTKLSVDMTF